MGIADKLVLQRQHHLKWRWLDRLELILMIVWGVFGFGFRFSGCGTHLTRTRVPPRRHDHLYLTAISEALPWTPRLIVEIMIRIVVLGVAFCLIWFGYINYVRGFGCFRLPSGPPIASLYAAIPLAGVLIALFTIEQLVNGIAKGFDHPEPPEEDFAIPPVDTGVQRGARPA